MARKPSASSLDAAHRGRPCFLRPSSAISVASTRHGPAARQKGGNVIISAPSDYREAARRRLPRFLFDYIDGGAGTESTMRNNEEALQSIALRQRALQGAGAPTLQTEILGRQWAMPAA